MIDITYTCLFLAENTYITEANILNQGRVNLRLGQGLLQQSVHNIIQLGILEATLAGLSQGSAQ